MLRSRVPLLLLVSACAGAPGSGIVVAPGLVEAELATVLATGETDLPPQPAESVLATSRRAWERLRERPGFAALPPSPCDFAQTSLLLVVASARDPAVRLVPRVSTEEGVDVVTVVGTVDEASGRGPSRSRALWLVVPARPRQLAVVLQEPGLRGVGEERTLAVHAPRE